jgi:glycosyltransferase involved in cell wall biosynthesis
MTGGTLSVIIPAFCEAENIGATLDNVTRALHGLPIAYEILVIDDGSTDDTAGRVVAFAGDDRRIRLLVNERNMGFGWTYRRGVQGASGDHIVMVHGDNAWGWETLRDLFSRLGEADVIIGYTRDMWRTRAWYRTVASKSFTFFVNVITGRQLRYYNGLQIHPARVLKTLTIQSTGYGFQAEVLAKSLRLNRTYLEVPMDLTERQAGESKAFRLRNAIDVLQTLTRLWKLPLEVANQ